MSDDHELSLLQEAGNASPAIVRLESVGEIHVMPDKNTTGEARLDYLSQYRICDSEGNCLYKAFEETDIWMKLCCRSRRNFDIIVRDFLQNRVMSIEYRHSYSFCLPQCLFSLGALTHTRPFVSIRCARNTVIGYVVNKSTYHPRFDIHDSERQVVCHVTSQDCLWQCCVLSDEIGFEVWGADDQQFGTIVRLAWQYNRGSHQYIIRLMESQSVNLTLCLIGAVMFINFLSFEEYEYVDTS